MSNIQLTLYPPNTQIIDVQPSDTIVLSIADNANIYASEIMQTWKMDGTSAGDFTPRTDNIGTPGGYYTHPEWFDYTSGSLVVTTTGTTDDNWWLHTYPYSATNIFENDLVINWTGKIIDMDIANSYFVVGAYLTHHNDVWANIGATLQLLVGFRTSQNGTTWIASVWRESAAPVGDNLYEESFSFDTGVSCADINTLQVAICDQGTKALFYINGSVVATTNEMPLVELENSTGSAYTGIHYRPFDGNTYPSIIQTDSMESVKCIKDSSVSIASRLTSVEPLDSITLNIDDLNDVSVTSVAGNDLLVYNVANGKWQNISRTSFMDGYQVSYSNLYPTTPQQATSRLVWWNADSGKTRTIVPSGTGLTTLTLDETANTMVIDTPTAVNGDLSGDLPNPTVIALQGVGVQSGTPTDHDVLIYSSSPAKWQHQSYATAGISAVGHTHAAADVTSGTFAIARIPTGTTSTSVSLGDHSHYVTNLAPKASPTTTWATKAPVWNDSTKTWDPTTIPTVPSTLPPSDGNYNDIIVSGGGTIMTIAGGIRQFPKVAPVSGKDYIASNGGTSTSTGTGTANTWYMVPWVAPTDITLASIRVYLTAAGAASSSLIIGIYSSGNDGYPTGSPIVTSGQLSTTTGTAAGYLTYSTTQALTENKQYWLFVGFSNHTTATLRTMVGAAWTALATDLSVATTTYNCLSGTWGTYGTMRNFTTTPVTGSDYAAVSPLALVGLRI